MGPKILRMDRGMSKSVSNEKETCFRGVRVSVLIQLKKIFFNGMALKSNSRKKGSTVNDVGCNLPFLGHPHQNFQKFCHCQIFVALLIHTFWFKWKVDGKNALMVLQTRICERTVSKL